MENVFRALADPARRQLLDRLFLEDGQSLGALVDGMEMTRFGVMKHLKVLEEAGLVVTRREGRSKLHFLNPVPIRLVHDRWISKFAEPLAGTMAGLKIHLEAENIAAAATHEEGAAAPSTEQAAPHEHAETHTHTRKHAPMATPKHVYRTYIRTSPDQVWKALTDGAMTANYYHGLALDGGTTPGADFNYKAPDGNTAVAGKVVEAQAPGKLVTTFSLQGEEATRADRPSRVTYTLEPAGPSATKLTLVHDDFDGETATFKGVEEGWDPIIAGLKTFLETGEPLGLPPMQ